MNKAKEKSIVFIISDDKHSAMKKAIKKINADGRYNVSMRSFCKAALNELLKGFENVFNLKGGKS